MALAGLFIYKQKAEVIDQYIYRFRSIIGR